MIDGREFDSRLAPPTTLTTPFAIRGNVLSAGRLIAVDEARNSGFFDTQRNADGCSRSIFIRSFSVFAHLSQTNNNLQTTVRSY